MMYNYDDNYDYDSNPWVQSQAKPRFEPQTQRQTRPQTQPQTQPQAQPQVRPQAQPQVQSQAKPRFEPQAQNADIPLESIRLDDVEERGGFQPLPSGSYEVEITKAKEGFTKNGTKFLCVRFAVADGEQTGNTTNAFFYLYTGSPQCLAASKGYYKRLRKCCGLQTETAGRPDELVGHRLRIRTSLRVDKYGENRSFVDDYYPHRLPAADATSRYTQPMPPVNGRLW